MSLTRDQAVIADVVLAALEFRRDDLCNLINALPRRQHADAAAKSLDLIALTFRNVIPPDQWQAFIAECRATRALLDLDDPTT
ncbi:hypothetical protein ACIHCM_01395 [Streptomyces sp. NPDC052023]|uniref:hypothetical protein n=1 Tax=Streptomyces sp. NPDC052023 TaxID=3365681 RepID=UPI0037D51675